MLNYEKKIFMYIRDLAGQVINYETDNLKNEIK